MKRFLEEIPQVIPTAHIGGYLKRAWSA